MNILLKMCESNFFFFFLHFTQITLYITHVMNVILQQESHLHFEIGQANIQEAWVPARWWGCPAASDRPGRTCDRSRVSEGVSLPGYTRWSRWCSPVYGCLWSSVPQSPHHSRLEPRTQAHPYPRSYRMSSIWYKHLFVFAWDINADFVMVVLYLT